MHIVVGYVGLTAIELDFLLLLCGCYTSSSHPSGYMNSAHSRACALARLGKPVNMPHTHAHAHIDSTYTHTHHIHAHVDLCICVCSTSLSLEPALPPFPSCNLSSLFGDMVETVTSFLFGEVASCDTTNSVCPQGFSQVASLCADKIMKFANGTRTAGYVSYGSMDWAMLCSYKLIICWVIPLCFGFGLWSCIVM